MLRFLCRKDDFGYNTFRIGINLFSKEDITGFLKQLQMCNSSIQFDSISNEMMNGDFGRFDELRSLKEAWFSL